jgi:hypothetical protein
MNYNYGPSTDVNEIGTSKQFNAIYKDKKIQLSFNSNFSALSILKIFNVQGQCIKNMIIKTQEGINNINLDFPYSGIYILKLNIGAQSYTQKIINH